MSIPYAPEPCPSVTRTAVSGSIGPSTAKPYTVQTAITPHSQERARNSRHPSASSATKVPRTASSCGAGASRIRKRQIPETAKVVAFAA